jgi:peptidoglycan hydrolase-like protein with peptidoglycan-binding domain
VRKRSSRAAAVAIEQPEAGGIGRLIVSHPREFVGVLLGGTATVIIVFNALFMQKGPHPAPIFAARPAINAPAPVVAQPTRVPAVQSLPAIAQPAPQPLNRVQAIAEIQRELTRRGFYEGAADGIWGARTDAGARDFGQAAGVKIDPNAPEELLRALTASTATAQPVPQPARRDPIAELIAPSPRVVAIQRALTDFGYGQIKPSGNYDAATRIAIEKFERDRKLPVTGQISDRFVRELSAMTGRPLE